LYYVTARRIPIKPIPNPFKLANVDKQRELNDAGRANAKEIGDAFRKLRIPVGQVHTSLLSAPSKRAN